MNKPDLILDVISKEEEQELLSELNKEDTHIVSNKYDRSGLIRLRPEQREEILENGLQEKHNF